jgi:hypothetical protein
VANVFVCRQDGQSLYLALHNQRAVERFTVQLGRLVSGEEVIIAKA